MARQRGVVSRGWPSANRPNSDEAVRHRVRAGTRSCRAIIARRSIGRLCYKLPLYLPLNTALFETHAGL